MNDKLFLIWFQDLAMSIDNGVTSNYVKFKKLKRLSREYLDSQDNESHQFTDWWWFMNDYCESITDRLEKEFFSPQNTGT